MLLLGDLIFIFKMHRDGFSFLALPIFLFIASFQVFMSIFNYRCINVLMCKTLCLSLEVFIDRSFNGVIFRKVVAFNHLRRRSVVICRLLFLLMDFTRIDHHQLITAYVLAHYSVVMDGGRWSRDRLDRSL